MIIIGIAGGSGSGKTSFAQVLTKELGEENAQLIYQDSYYIDRSKQFEGDGSLNFDNPDAIDWPYMVEQLQALGRGEPINQPLYDFASHTRKTETISVEPKDYIVLDGILLLHHLHVRELFDVTAFVDCPEPVRFQRRLERDMSERGRSEDGVRKQYQCTVLPMHDQYVEPSNIYADYIVDGQSEILPQVQEFVRDIKKHLE